MNRRDKPQIEDLLKKSSLTVKAFLSFSLVIFLFFSNFVQTPSNYTDKDKILVIIKDKSSQSAFIDSLDKVTDKYEVVIKRGIFIKEDEMCFSKPISEQHGYIACKIPQSLGTIEKVHEYIIYEDSKKNKYKSSIIPVTPLRIFIMIFLWLIIIVTPTYFYQIKKQ